MQFILKLISKFEVEYILARTLLQWFLNVMKPLHATRVLLRFENRLNISINPRKLSMFYWTFWTEVKSTCNPSGAHMIVPSSAGVQEGVEMSSFNLRDDEATDCELRSPIEAWGGGVNWYFPNRSEALNTNLVNGGDQVWSERQCGRPKKWIISRD